MHNRNFSQPQLVRLLLHIALCIFGLYSGCFLHCYRSWYHQPKQLLFHQYVFILSVHCILFLYFQSSLSYSTIELYKLLLIVNSLTPFLHNALKGFCMIVGWFQSLNKCGDWILVKSLLLILLLICLLLLILLEYY